MSQRILILGALSDIATAYARLQAARGARLLLVGRDTARLDKLAADLTVRGAATVAAEACDLGDVTQVDRFGQWAARFGGLDVVLLAYGTLGDQRTLEKDLHAAATLIDTNFRSAALWSLAAARQIEQQGSGTLAVIGSVAGDRGRQSNFVYGATKAGLATLIEGIAHRLAPGNGCALLIKPGFVDTAMTAHLPNRSGPLWATPDKVAAIIDRAIARRKAVVYAPGFWRLIMAIIRTVPRAIFHRTRL